MWDAHAQSRQQPGKERAALQQTNCAAALLALSPMDAVRAATVLRSLKVRDNIGDSSALIGQSVPSEMSVTTSVLHASTLTAVEGETLL